MALLLYIIINYALKCFVLFFVWCLSVPHTGGFLHDIILLIPCYYHIGEPV